MVGQIHLLVRQLRQRATWWRERIDPLAIRLSDLDGKHSQIVLQLGQCTRADDSAGNARPADPTYKICNLAILICLK